MFSPPRWLRELGLASWLVVGALLVLVGLIWLVGATAEIGQPVIAGFVIGCVTSPLLAISRGHRSASRTRGKLVELLHQRGKNDFDVEVARPHVKPRLRKKASRAAAVMSD